MITLLSFQVLALTTLTSKSAHHTVYASMPLFMQLPLSGLIRNINALPPSYPTQYLVEFNFQDSS